MNEASESPSGGGSPAPVNLREKLALFTERWSPRVIAELNELQFKLAKLEGEFVWHQHDHTDEAFLVIEGALHITLSDREVTVNAGELFVVPRGEPHRPRASGECQVLLIEPRGVRNTGEVISELTAEQDRWI